MQAAGAFRVSPKQNKRQLYAHVHLQRQTPLPLERLKSLSPLSEDRKDPLPTLCPADEAPGALFLSLGG